MTRRVPSELLFDVGLGKSPDTPPVRDPDADRAAIDAFEAGTARAAHDESPVTRLGPQPRPIPEPPPTPAGRNGLSRRVPGAHLAAALRGGERAAATFPAAPSPSARPAAARQLDPTSERDNLNAFLDGFADGVGNGSTSSPSETPQQKLTTQKEGGR